MPGAWRITFDEDREGDANAGQDVLLAWAEAIRSVKVPGYRATRDAHCAASTPVAP